MGPTTPTWEFGRLYRISNSSSGTLLGRATMMCNAFEAVQRNCLKAELNGRQRLVTGFGLDVVLPGCMSARVRAVTSNHCRPFPVSYIGLLNARVFAIEPAAGQLYATHAHVVEYGSRVTLGSAHLQESGDLLPAVREANREPGGIGCAHSRKVSPLQRAIP